MLVTVASTTTSQAKPWSKRQGKLRGAAPSPNTVCGMLIMVSDCDSSVHKDSFVSSSHTGNLWKYVSLNVYTML